mgnify:CR=1 FL=1
MVRVSCTNPGCTARYNVPESKLGRRATCATCGKPFLLQAPPPADALDDLAGLTRGELIEASQQADVPEAVPVMVGYAQSAPDVRSAAHGQTFLGALREYALALLLIPKTLVRPWNLVTLLIVWLLCSLQILAPFALCFGILMVVIINGWYLAYLLKDRKSVV